MIQDIKNRFGKNSLLQLVFYPIIALVTTPIRLLQSIWNCRVLLRSKSTDFSHFNIHTGLNSLFYYTRALNLKRFGRSGKSPYLGLGDFNLARCFHYSLVSLFSYWKASTWLVLFCMFGWWLSFTIFIYPNPSWQQWIVMILVLVSTNFYANTFRFQNYNVLGWLFFPLFIFGLLNGHWYLAGFAIFLSTFGSFTVVFIGSILAVFVALISWSLFPIIVIIPAALKLSLHFLPFLRTGDSKKVLFSVMKAIGLNRGAAKYRRKNKGKKLTIFDCYHLLIIIQFVVCYYWIHVEIPYLLLVALLLFLSNTMILRFADEQSIYMLLFTLVTTYALDSPNIYIIISLWIAISPLPFLTGFDYDTRVLSVVPKMKPFNISGYIQKMEHFLSPIQRNEKVWMSFGDPGDVYENIFEGYRQLIELPSYVANQKSFLLFPEWWTVFELNYEGAPNIWGRSVEEVTANMKQWHSRYAIIYQDSNSDLDPKWKEAGFHSLNAFDWSQFSDDFRYHKKFSQISFKWFLLELKE